MRGDGQERGRKGKRKLTKKCEGSKTSKNEEITKRDI